MTSCLSLQLIYGIASDVNDSYGHWLMKWPVSLGHQAITWNNVDFSLENFGGVYLRAISLAHANAFQYYTITITATSPMGLW